MGIRAAMAMKTILVCGYGPGISNAVAERFGREGFSVGLVARNEQRLAEGVSALAQKNVRAQAFPADLGDPSAVRAVVGKAREALGPITVLHWNAYGSGAGDLLAATDAELRSVFDVAFVGFVTAVQTALADMRKGEQPAILVTNGGLGYHDPQVDAWAAQINVMGLAVANSAKRKAVGLLSAKLASEGIYVGEVVVTGSVKGTAFDKGDAKLDPAEIAERFWTMYRERREVSTRM
jgi:NAD(P)-dependent dehydrogenase (short-subunit alcohol dehydrogenase family)